MKAERKNPRSLKLFIEYETVTFTLKSRTRPLGEKKESLSHRCAQYIEL